VFVQTASVCISRFPGHGTRVVSDVTLPIPGTSSREHLEENVAAANKLEYQLTVPKNRGGEPLLDETTVVIDSDVWIDESRNI